MGVAEDAQRQLAEKNAEAKAAQDARDAAAERAKNRKPLVISGRVGGPFNIDGQELGIGGQVFFGDRYVETTRWAPNSIKGTLPADIKPGKVKVVITGGDTIFADWPATQPLGNPPGGPQAINVPEPPVKAKA